MNFNIKNFEIWAPGFANKQAFAAWIHSGLRATEPLKPPNKQVPAMIRRRASPIGKMALETAFALVTENEPLQAVFCSRHGEVHQSIKLLNDLLLGEETSPMTFSLSVHNSAVGIFSMAAKSTLATTAISAGADSLGAGLLEAASQMEETGKDILMVFFDAPLPLELKSWQQNEGLPFALGLRLSPGQNFELKSDSQKFSPSQAPCLALSAFLLGEDSSLQLDRASGRWLLQRSTLCHV